MLLLLLHALLSVRAEDPLASPNGYLKYDIKKGTDCHRKGGLIIW